MPAAASKGKSQRTAPAPPAGLSPKVLVAGAIGFDLGVQAALISHQTIVYGIDPGARSRLNATLFTGTFIGMAAGSALGTVLLAEWGWMGVVGLGTVASLAALAVRVGIFRIARLAAPQRA